MPEQSNLTRRRLDNGLEILLYPSFDAPVASFWVWYRVGSRNELPGVTGVSHWVEHMMFKGTPKVPAGEVMLRVNQNGGELNAFTSYDYTAYHQTLPADRIDLAVELEADRMTQLLIDPEEVASERTVILSERQGAFNNPSYVLWDETVGTAFRAHSYRHFVIGHEHDLKTMTRDDLYSYYQSFYAPNNAVVVVSGAFDTDAMMSKIAEQFGPIQASDSIDLNTVVEAPQVGERRVTLRQPAPAPEVLIAYHVPAIGHPDEYPLELLAAIFSGAGGRMGKSARLPRSMVATGKARAANATFLKGLDPFLFLLGGTGLPDGDPEELDRLLTEQLDLVKSAGVGEDELNRARKLLTTAFHYQTESVTDQAYGLGEAAVYGDVTKFFTYPGDLAAVTVEDIRRVTATYFDTSNRTVGYLYPDLSGGGGEAVPSISALRFGLGGVGAPALQPFEQETIESGLTLLAQPQPNDPVVSARIRIAAGSADDPTDKFGVANLAAQMLLRGSENRTREEFEEACDELGVSIGVGSGRENTEFSITCLAEDLTASLDLVADALFNPVFDARQLELSRREAVAGLRQAEENTQAVADQSVRELIYPIDHPLRHRTVGTLEGITNITQGDLTSYHEKKLLSAPITAAVVGGFTSTAALSSLIADRFGSRVRMAKRQTIAAAPAPSSTHRTVVRVAGKEQADVALAIPVLGATSAGFYDLDLADTILGQFGMMGRIGDSVRQKQGLAYYAYCSISPGRDQSIWFARAGVDPTNIDRAIDSILDVIKDIQLQGFTADELNGTRQLMTGRIALTMQTNAGIAQLLQTIHEFDLGLDYIARYPELLGSVTLESAHTSIVSALAVNAVQIAIAGP